MDEEMKEIINEWHEKLPLVLDLIKTNPDAIVDDTSVEKLLSWLGELVKNENERKALLHENTNVLHFISTPIDSLLSDSSRANFSLRFAGFMAGCDDKICEMLIANECLENLFAKFEIYQETYFSNAVVKCAFFEGLSSVIKNITGFTWTVNISGA